MQGLLQGELQPSARLAGHLDRCLACRACEAVCPANVPYGRMIDLVRVELNAEGFGATRRERLLASVATRPRVWRALAWLLRGVQRAGLTALLARLGIAPRMLRRLPPPHAPRYPHARSVPPDGAIRGEIDLFLGCIADPFDAVTHESALRMLRALGYRVRLPAAGRCCGALDTHAGRAEAGRAQLERTLREFEGRESPILFSSSGCGAPLTEAADWLDTEAARAFSARCREITAWLAEQPLGNLAWTTPREPVAVHVPCTQRNGLRDAGAAERLLAALPGQRVVPLAHQACCGAAGSYMLAHPDNADALADQTLDAMQQTGCRVLLTTNIGCALHLRGRARERGQDFELLHPLSWLARHLAA